MSTLIARVAVTITSGQYLSSAAALGHKTPNVLHMPAAWDAAPVSFATSPDGINFYFVYDTDGAAITLPADTNRRINLPAVLGNTNGLKVASGVPGTTVNQTADRVLYLEVWE